MRGLGQAQLFCTRSQVVMHGFWPILPVYFALYPRQGCSHNPGYVKCDRYIQQALLSSDDYSVYNGYDVKAQQKCLAHLRRHFKKLIKLPGVNNQKIGEKFVKLIDEAFRNYSLFQQNRNISELFAWAWEFKLKVKSSLDKWIALAGGEASKLLRSPKRQNRSMVVFFRPSRGTSRQ